jgi:hypothetical protein
MKRKVVPGNEMEVVSVGHGTMTMCIIGESPLICNSMSLKATKELLLPAGKKTTAQKKTSLKHDPLREFRASMVRRREDENGPTRVLFPAPAFKGAIMTSALDIPLPVKKSEIGRLSWVHGQKIDIYGVPQMFMAVVRNSDINRTPDIRTRALFPEWAARVTLKFVEPILTAPLVAQLMEFAGSVCGVGDFRQEKGKGNYGQFTICGEDDLRFQSIIRNGGMAAQDAAIADPECHDSETEELWAFYQEEVRNRGMDHMLNAAL